MIEVEWDFTAVQKALSRLNNEVFENAIESATKEIAKELHNALLINTPVKTGNLLQCWNTPNNLAFTVVRVGNGFEVTLINDAQDDKEFKYGKAVNYGHKTTNGGWVMGKFFVEKSEAQTEPKCYDIVKRNLQKYFVGWLSGK